MIGSVAVLPSTPLLLPDLPGEAEPTIALLAAASSRVLEGTAAADVVVVLAGGDRLVVDRAPSTDLRGFGLSLKMRATTAVTEDLVDLLGPVEGMTVGAADSADLRVLVRHVAEGRPVLGMSVPADATPAQAEQIAAGLLRLGADRRVALVVAGDLGAGHGPKPPRPEAAEASRQLDDLVVAALDNGRPTDLLHLDADLARRSCARATGALRVLGALLGRVPVGTVVRAAAAPLGVGYVLAQGG